MKNLNKIRFLSLNESKKQSLKKKHVKKIITKYGYKMYSVLTNIVAWWSELLTTNHEFPGSIPGSTMFVFP